LKSSAMFCQDMEQQNDQQTIQWWLWSQGFPQIPRVQGNRKYATKISNGGTRYSQLRVFQRTTEE
jgi:hypothetical protein